MHTKGPFLPIYRTLFIRMCHVMMDRVFQKLGFENGHDRARAVIQTSYTLKKTIIKLEKSKFLALILGRQC